MKSLTQPFVRVDGKLIHEGMAEYMSRGRSGACTIPAQTGSVGMHRQAVPVHKANPFTPGRLDTCDGVHGRSSTHLQRPRHQLQLSLQKDNSVDHRSRSCSRDSVVVRSAIGQHRIVCTVTQPLLCLAGLLFAQQQSLQAIADQVRKKAAKARLRLVKLGPQV